ncbi:MAG: sugar phosphate isomerase/epimerase [Nitrospirota bacterium]|nr:MAG: sugar phosphate isomerase/epimerase [Nitrospirota bacterium]
MYFNHDSLDIADIGLLEDTFSLLDYKPELSIHAPFIDLSPAAIDDRVREATMYRFDQLLKVAQVLRPGVIVFHSGYEKWKYALEIDIWLEKSLLTWRDILGRCQKLGIKIAIENIFEDTPDNLFLLAGEMGSEDFGLCFDTGHFNLFSSISLDEWIGKTREHIIELHLHDNDGRSDAHGSLGSGSFDFHELFSLLKGRDDILKTIEAHTPEGALKSLEILDKY